MHCYIQTFSMDNMDELLKIHNNTMNDMMNEYKKINLHTTISRIIEKEENSIHNYKILPKKQN